jgi:hypothetical protein
MPPTDRFDAGYYHRHYVGADRVHSARQLGLLASGIFGLAGWFGVDIRAVLDVGAGLGLWRGWLERCHPRVKYRSVDVSPYACEHYGHELRDISTWRSRERFDLVVCHSVLQYLDDDGAARAIENLGTMCRGLLYLEAITRADLDVVDVARTDTAVHARTGAWYRRRLERHFVQVGAGLWASRRSGLLFYELEAAGR